MLSVGQTGILILRMIRTSAPFCLRGWFVFYVDITQSMSARCVWRKIRFPQRRRVLKIYT